MNSKFTSCHLELGKLFFLKENSNAKQICLHIPYIQIRILSETFAYLILDSATNNCFLKFSSLPPLLSDSSITIISKIKICA